MPVRRSSSRRYTGTLSQINGATVLFQRSADITSKIEDGTTDLGIVGLDRYYECRKEGGDAILLMETLGFGSCRVVIAVPDAWVDVTSIQDLADLSLEFHQIGREFRVVTMYPRLVNRYFLANGVNYYTLVSAAGTLESAPASGYADLIVDITDTGSTLRENHLKTIEGGTILSSQACLVGNIANLTSDETAMSQVRAVLERMEAHIRAGGVYRLIANVRGSTDEAIAKKVLARPDLAGLQGPTVSPVFGREPGWYSLSLVVQSQRLLDAVEHLRAVGATDISASQVSYLFQRQCNAFDLLMSSTGQGKSRS
jgi:ATP phosphoribosyltransferase